MQWGAIAGPRSLVPGPAASASREKLVEMQFLSPHEICRAKNSGGSVQSAVVSNSPGDSDGEWAQLKTMLLTWMMQGFMEREHDAVQGGVGTINRAFEQKQ